MEFLPEGGSPWRKCQREINTMPLSRELNAMTNHFRLSVIVLAIAVSWALPARAQSAENETRRRAKAKLSRQPTLI